ncbi:MAG TPA: phenylalanine--tRNA ligase subunit beta [Candidatus Saccharimonadales bacterium]|nr:phenylalanine--tRNA ligase subunit beta [Candidatus Saccharimonadales bacterium]
MRVSLAWIQEFTDVDRTVEELVELIGSRLVEVEETINWGERFKGVLIAEITAVQPHDNADKLNIYQISVGKDETRQVVSGDKTLQKGDKVGYIPPGVMVPSSADHKSPVVIEEVSMRGVISQGMLGSARELCLSDEHSKVQVLDTDAAVGTPFAEAYNLNDIILDIENKSFTHRPDCFGLLGIAREVAAIQGKQFESPSWFKSDVIAVEKGSGSLPLEVTNEIADLVPRYMAVSVRNVNLGQSSLMMQSMLTRMGIRPINNIVDITNYLMLLTGQPLHAFDFDKVAVLSNSNQAKIIVRAAKEGDKLALLDGRTIDVRPGAVVIATPEKPIALGGIMGGSETEIDEHTTNIIIESANFDMYNLRTTGMTHGLFTDALTRFAKGQSPTICAPVLGHALGMLIETSAHAEIGSEVIDIYPKPKQSHVITCNSGWANNFLGTTLETSEMHQILQNIECDVQADKGWLKVTPPLWRSDLWISEDIADEIGRLHGFDTIEPTMPMRDFHPALPHPLERLKQEARAFLADAGANEVVTYSFVSDALMRQTNQENESAFHLANSLSPELAYLRTNLLGSLLTKVHPNHKAGFDTFALFEQNQTQHKGELDDEGLPREHHALALIWSATPKAYAVATQGAPYYQAKYYFEELLQRLGVPDLHYRLVRPHTLDSVPLWLQMRIELFDLGRSAIVMKEDVMLGVVGEPSQAVRKAQKLPEAVAMFEGDLEEILKVRAEKPAYVPLSRFPGTTQDLCFRVSSDLLYNDLVLAITDFLQHQHDIVFSVSPLDIFQHEDQPNYKQITVRLTLHHRSRTLTTAEINELLDHLSVQIGSALRAERV